MKYTEETNILEALQSHDAAEPIFKKLGLKCPDCIAVTVETLKDAARYHHVDIQIVLKELNRLAPSDQ